LLKLILNLLLYLSLKLCSQYMFNCIVLNIMKFIKAAFNKIASKIDTILMCE